MKRKLKGFTLAELVITIAIVIILSVVSIPIYRGYIDKAKLSEGYALLGTILSAQKAYYSEYGNFLDDIQSSFGGGHFSNFEEVLGIDARGNQYFTRFWFDVSNNVSADIKFDAYVLLPQALRKNPSKPLLLLHYEITSGSKYTEVANNGWDT